MRSRLFAQVDVFTAVAFKGNPLAVVLDGTDLTDTQMQSFAAWTNLSETTFVLPATHAQADYRVRIFTPAAELPFAGHPTLGTCHAWLHAGGKPKQPGIAIQECAAGLIQIKLSATLHARPAFAAPPLIATETDEATIANICKALGIQTSSIRAAKVLNNGPVWWGLLLPSAPEVAAIKPDHHALAQLPKVGVIGKTLAPNDAADFLVRAFAASIGVPEDPVTGSLNASLAQWLIAENIAPATYRAAQGSSMGRDGKVWITSEADELGKLKVWVGGDSVTCINGTVVL